MGEDAARFRKRAKECRDRAERADYVLREFLLEVANDLEAEADMIDAETRTGGLGASPQGGSGSKART